MKEGIHPNYVEATVICTCGHTFKTYSTKPLIKLEICAKCHPLFTGKQKFVDTAGRIEKFTKKFEKLKKEPVKKKPKKVKVEKVKPKILTTTPRRKKST